jgi:hypothetical protein
LTAQLVHRELKGLGAIKKNASASMLLILNDPVATTVLTEQESGGSGIRSRLAESKSVHRQSPSTTTEVRFNAYDFENDGDENS